MQPGHFPPPLHPMKLFSHPKLLSVAGSALLLSAAMTCNGATVPQLARGDLVRLKQGEMLMFKGADFAGAGKGQEFTVLKFEPRETVAYVAYYKDDGTLIAVSVPASSLEPLPANGWNDLLRGIEAFREQRHEAAKRLLQRASEDAQYRTLAAPLSGRIMGAMNAAAAVRSSDPSRAAAAKQGCINTLQGLRDTAEQLLQQGYVSLAFALAEGTDKLGSQALGNTAVPASKVDREDLAARAAIVNRTVIQCRQALGLRRLAQASRLIEEGLQAEPVRPELKAFQARIAKEISEADSHHQNADKMRARGPKGVVHALTALEMGLKLCVDHPKLIALKKEMQSAFEERTAPPITQAFMKGAGAEVSAKAMEEGRKLYTNRCTECHDLELLDSRSVAAWREVVAGMSRRAKIDGAQQAKIVEYLAVAQRGLDAGP